MRSLVATESSTVAEEFDAQLSAAGMVVDQTASGEETLDQARHYDYDIILLDQQFSDMTGCEALRRLRAAQVATPVILLSRLPRGLNPAEALGAGADDVASTLSQPGEFLARVQAIIRRNRGFSQSTIHIGPLTLDLNEKSAAVNGTPVHLTCKEYRLLELLVLRKNVVLSKETFLNHLYGGLDEPDAKIIDVFICKMRKKLSRAGADGIIGTVWGHGYVLRTPSAAPASGFRRQRLKLQFA